MTRRDLARLLIKVFGVLILLSTAVTLPVTINNFDWQLGAWRATKVVYDLPSLVMAAIYYFGPIAIYAALGLSFMWWSGRIVDRSSLSPQEDALQVASTDLKSIEVSMVTVIGLYFLVDGLNELVRFTFSPSLTYTLTPSWGGTLKSIWSGMTRFRFVALLQIAVKLAIAAGLILRRGTTVAMLHRARHWVQKWRAWPYEPDRDSAH